MVVKDTGDRVALALVIGLLNSKTKTIVQVAAGFEHNVCLIADGLLYVCGSGHYGQLGVWVLGTKKTEYNPRGVEC